MTGLTGRTCDEAVRILKDKGIEPEITVTYPLKGKRNVGTLRVIKYDEASRVLLCAEFIDTVKEETTVGDC